MIKKVCLLFCHCSGWATSPSKLQQLTEMLHELDADVFEVNDLCAVSLNEKDFLKSVNKKYDQKIVIACYPRAVKNLLLQNNNLFENYEVLSFKELSKEQISDYLTVKVQLKKGKAKYTHINSSLEVPAWYPIIDQSRCTMCGQCADFCLFGVYNFTRKKLSVVNPLSCKNKCPACGRTCPSSSIIFPRLVEKSALTGAEPEENNNGHIGKKDSLFVMLNDRNKERRSIFKQNIIQIAEEERKKALNEIKPENLKEN